MPFLLLQRRHMPTLFSSRSRMNEHRRDTRGDERIRYSRISDKFPSESYPREIRKFPHGLSSVNRSRSVYVRTNERCIPPAGSYESTDFLVRFNAITIHAGYSVRDRAANVLRSTVPRYSALGRVRAAFLRIEEPFE